ncbi:uncharacterized protein LOC130433213 [Triplophysa dalaica]|uniref:uncharacterized protein LOC130433213 n=1 Tax=Triplophysa dalaica TaxID=1582913 RepID=UPI0024E02E96|nr:uncharacterized protein LOC130433213 [Triplophysa dalaica]
MESRKNQPSLRFISWNTMGIKSTKDKIPKLPLVLDELETQKADVAFLQETHLGPQDYEKIKEKLKGWRIYYTVYSHRSKGVAILVNKKTSFHYICHDEDYSGGYIVLFCRISGQLYTLVNLYNHKADKDMLHRLKDYLTAITTKGVLLVGGDFNTVLDPNFDRKTLSDQTYQSSLRCILEEFTSSLNLIDIFAHIHATDEGFTRSQNESHSRLDMFFMPTNRAKDVIYCENVKAKPRLSKTMTKQNSDHDPLILEIKRTLSPDNEIPEVSSFLSHFEYNGIPEEIREGKINGAEILRSIRSLPDSKQQLPDRLSVQAYKTNDLPMTEILKISYNIMLNTKYVPEPFSLCDASSDEPFFNVDYMIFTQILAKRLKVFLTSSFRSKKKVPHAYRNYVTLSKDQQKIKMSFLKKSLSSLKNIQPSPPKDFTILKYLLPKASSLQKTDYRILRQGCPLTRPILTLALKQLENEIINAGTRNTSVSPFRQCLVIFSNINNDSTISMLVEKFKKHSGIKIHSKWMKIRPPYQRLQLHPR